MRVNYGILELPSAWVNVRTSFFLMCCTFNLYIFIILNGLWWAYKRTKAVLSWLLQILNLLSKTHCLVVLDLYTLYAHLLLSGSFYGYWIFFFCFKIGRRRTRGWEDDGAQKESMFCWTEQPHFSCIQTTKGWFIRQGFFISFSPLFHFSIKVWFPFTWYAVSK